MARFGSDHQMATVPRPTSAPATSADRWAGRGAGGRPDSAATTGRRETARAGHHDAAVAVQTASTIPTASTHHGTSNRSMRCPAAGSTAPATASHSSNPAAVPDDGGDGSDDHAVRHQHQP